MQFTRHNADERPYSSVTITRLQQKEQSEGNHSISLHRILFADAISVHSMTCYLCSSFRNDKEWGKMSGGEKEKLIAKWYKLQRVIEARRNRPKRRKTFQSIGDGWQECGEAPFHFTFENGKKRRSFSVPFPVDGTQKRRSNRIQCPDGFLIMSRFRSAMLLRVCCE